MIKLTIAAVVALAVYIALGVVLPVSGHVALVVTVLGTWGAITYKGLVAIFAMYLLAARM